MTAYSVERTLALPAFWAGAEKSRKQCGTPGGHAVAIRTALQDGKKLSEIAEYHQWLGRKPLRAQEARR